MGNSNVAFCPVACLGCTCVCYGSGAPILEEVWRHILCSGSELNKKRNSFNYFPIYTEVFYLKGRSKYKGSSDKKKKIGTFTFLLWFKII